MSAAPQGADAILAHYRTDDLVDRIIGALDQAGLGEGALNWEVLAPLDQFHVGGAAATASLITALDVTPGARVLDVGSGLGGPARHLAAVTGCDVTGIDLNPAFVAVAASLAARCGLAERVRFQTGDATRLPFPEGHFDAALTQHVAMNIADRAALYAGLHAVLRPGGRLAIYDVVAGSAGDVHLPVPWARERTQSFLLSPAAMRDAVEAAGFGVLSWQDSTAQGLAWLEAQRAAQESRPDRLRALALPLVMGAAFQTMTANLGRSLKEGRAGLVQAVVERTTR